MVIMEPLCLKLKVINCSVDLLQKMIFGSCSRFLPRSELDRGIFCWLRNSYASVMATPRLVYKYSQINPVNTNNEWAMESVRINGVSVLGGSCI